MQATETALNNDIWSNSLAGGSDLPSVGTLNTPPQSNIGCLSSQPSESSALSLAQCTLSLRVSIISSCAFALKVTVYHIWYSDDVGSTCEESECGSCCQQAHAGSKTAPTKSSSCKLGVPANTI